MQTNTDDSAGVWRYAFSVEFIEQESEPIINDIFNRMNKNVAKLTPQELRHALFSGFFLKTAEELAEEMQTTLPNFPNIAPQSRRQMKDVESVATLLLFIEVGERSFSQADIDKAFGDREEEWPEQSDTTEAFRTATRFMAQILARSDSGVLQASRLRNQTDFYSLFAAVVELQRSGDCPSAADAFARLTDWLAKVRSVERGEIPADRAVEESRYLSAARAASNDAGPRRTRINIIKAVLLGR